MGRALGTASDLREGVSLCLMERVTEENILVVAIESIEISVFLLDVEIRYRHRDFLLDLPRCVKTKRDE